MVTAVTSFGRSGLADWLVQRVGGVLLLAWLCFVGGVLLGAPELGYGEWKALFESTWMRVFTLAALLSLAAHAWVGLWCVLTDYVTPRMLGARADLLRGLLVLLALATLFAYVVWGIEIVWGS